MKNQQLMRHFHSVKKILCAHELSNLDSLESLWGPSGAPM